MLAPLPLLLLLEREKEGTGSAGSVKPLIPRLLPSAGAALPAAAAADAETEGVERLRLRPREGSCGRVREEENSEAADDDDDDDETAAVLADAGADIASSPRRLKLPPMLPVLRRREGAVLVALGRGSSIRLGREGNSALVALLAVLLVSTESPEEAAVRCCVSRSEMGTRFGPLALPELAPALAPALLTSLPLLPALQLGGGGVAWLGRRKRVRPAPLPAAAAVVSVEDAGSGSARHSPAPMELRSSSRPLPPLPLLLLLLPVLCVLGREEPPNRRLRLLALP